MFNQLLQHFPRTEFAALVKKHAAERDAKGFACWTQFVSMLEWRSIVYIPDKAESVVKRVLEENSKPLFSPRAVQRGPLHPMGLRLRPVLFSAAVIGIAIAATIVRKFKMEIPDETYPEPQNGNPG